MLPAIKPFVKYNIDNGSLMPVYKNHVKLSSKYYLSGTFLHQDILNIIYKYIPFFRHNEIHRNCIICEVNLLKKLYDLYKIDITFSNWLLRSKHLC